MFDPSYDFLYCETYRSVRELIKYILDAHLPLTPYNPLIDSPVLVERVSGGVDWTTAVFPLYHWLGKLKLLEQDKLTGELWFPDAPFRKGNVFLNYSQEADWVFPSQVKVTVPDGETPGVIKWLEREELDSFFFVRHPGCNRPIWSWEQRRAKIPPGESRILNCEGWLLGGAELENCQLEEITLRQKQLLDIAFLPQLIQELIDSFQLPEPQCLKSFVIEETWDCHQTSNFVDHRGLAVSIVGLEFTNPIYTPLPEWWSYSCLVYASEFNLQDKGVEPFIDFSRTNYAGEYEPQLGLWKLPREGDLEYSAPVNFPFQGHNFSLQGNTHPCQVNALSQFSFKQGYGLIVDKEGSYSQTDYGYLLALDLDSSNEVKTGFDQGNLGYWANLWPNTFYYKLNPTAAVGASMRWWGNADLGYTFTPLYSSPPWWFYDDTTASLCHTLTLPVFWASCYLQGTPENQTFKYFDQKHVLTLALNNGANYNNVTLFDGFTSTEENLDFEIGPNGFFPENDPSAYVEFKRKTFVGQCDRQFHSSRPTGIWGRDENGVILSKAQVIAKLEQYLEAHDLRFDGEIVRIVPPPDTPDYNPTITAEGGKHYLFYCSGTLIYPSGVWDTVGAELVSRFNSNNQANVLYFVFQNGSLGEEQAASYFEDAQNMRNFPQLFTYDETITLGIGGGFAEAEFSYIAKRFLRPYYNSEEGYFLCDRNFWMGNARRIREIHAALQADKFAYQDETQAALRVANLGYYLERIARVLGISVNPDGSIRSVRQRRVLPATGTIAAGWGLGQWELNEGGTFLGQVGGNEGEERDGYAYVQRSNVIKKSVFNDDDFEVAKGNIVLCENLMQLFESYLEDLDKGLNWQEMGGAVIPNADTTPNADGSQKFCSIEGMGTLLAEVAYMLSAMSKNTSQTFISSLVTQAITQEILEALGQPLQIKYLPAEAGDPGGDGYRTKIPFPGLSEDAPTVLEQIIWVLQNVAQLKGALANPAELPPPPAT